MKPPVETGGYDLSPGLAGDAGFSRRRRYGDQPVASAEARAATGYRSTQMSYPGRGTGGATHAVNSSSLSFQEEYLNLLKRGPRPFRGRRSRAIPNRWRRVLRRYSLDSHLRGSRLAAERRAGVRACSRRASRPTVGRKANLTVGATTMKSRFRVSRFNPAASSDPPPGGTPRREQAKTPALLLLMRVPSVSSRG
jgi:hypothetical protein